MQISKKKKNNKIAFNLIIILIPVIILAGIEGILRLTGYGDAFSLFIQKPEKGYEKYMMLNPEVGEKYFQKLEYTRPGSGLDIFLKEKPENTFRIFVMGSSTVVGFPFDQNLMFSRILNLQLENAFPNKKIEVINTAITAINSFTLFDYTDQILDYEPDAVLIYAGHNEFYGALGIGSNETMSRSLILTRLHLALMDFKIYQLLRNLITGITQKVTSQNEVGVEGTLMKRIVASNDIPYKSDVYDIGIERYKQNMDDILKKIKKRNVPVFLSETVCNVKDMEPFSSDLNGAFEPAIEVYRKAQTAEANHEYEKAKDLYYRAKDLDCVRFRASEDINLIIDELAGKYNAFLIPMLSVFQDHSPNKLIGNNLMTEHVHPNIEGYFLMAEAFFDKILESGIIGTPELSQRITREYVKKNYGYTILDSLFANHHVQMLKGEWPFVKIGEKEINYMDNYKPKSFLDSIAYIATIDENKPLIILRYQVAQQYEKEEKNFEAFKEYDAILRTNPYIGVYYRDAASALIKLSDLQQAFKYFKKSLEYEESGFAYYKIGEIYFYMGDYDRAISYFQKSYPLLSDDKKVFPLAEAYAAYVYSNKISAAQEIANELKKLNAEKYLNIAPKEYLYGQLIPYQTRDKVITAKKLINENKNEEALQILEPSLKTYDSNIANRLIGEIYLQQQNIEMALFYFKKEYDQFRFDPRFLYNLALAYHFNNDDQGANRCMQEIINIEPDFNNLGQLRNILSVTN